VKRDDAQRYYTFAYVDMANSYCVQEVGITAVGVGLVGGAVDITLLQVEGPEAGRKFGTVAASANM
jgi:hypothetical protein